MFHPPHVLDCFRRDDALRRHAVERAAPWRALSVDELWELVFGNTLPRSWMVWSDGPCPSCGDDVNMYDWVMAPFERPWKLTCPSCGDIFPKNDFHAFYRSGLDAAGVFDPAGADRSLLVNTEHPDADDPLSTFGVDDGHGFVNDAGHRWRFVATWLVYGQWKGLVWTGIERLAEAFAATGDREYSRRAGVLLDRLSDLYPTFDYSQEGFVYEKPGNRGYLSNWHDACAEVLSLTIAYDRVREALSDDEDLVTFLSGRASRFDLPTPKDSGPQICRNIEQRILQDTLDHVDRIESNFPTTQMAVILIEAVLRGEGGMEPIHELFDDAISRATAVDGLSGEKGLSGYACIAPRTLAHYLALFARALPGFLDGIFARHPALHDLYRFHIDTWVGTRFYPNVGDCGAWTRTCPTYAAVPFTTDGGPTMAPSMFTFFWQLYQTTGDVAFVQVLYHANGDSTEGLPHDVCCADPAALRRQVGEVISSHGVLPPQPSVNKQDWHLAILRGADERRGPVAWLDYDSGAMNSVYAYRLDVSVRGRGAHSHADGMHLGLFYRGVDLIPDLGYPPVNFGGWSSPQAEWYKMSAAHNTVVVDGLDLANAAGKTLWWHDGDPVRGICVSAPGLIEGEIFERTLVIVDTGEADAYIVDVFRVQGGSDHTRFLLGPCGPLQTTGLDLAPAPDYGHDTLMRAFRADTSPSPGWVADWSVDDRAGLAPPGSELHLRYTDLSRGVEAGICESWACYGSYGDKDEVWLQRPWLRRRTAGSGPLASTFAGVLEPCDGHPAVVSVRRVDEGDGTRADERVELDIELSCGSHDHVLVAIGGSVRVERDGVDLTPS